MLLFGPTVLTSFLFFLPFWLLFIGHRVLLIWGSLVFLIWNCFLCLKSLLVTDCLLRKNCSPQRRPCRPLVFSSFSVGKGQEIRHGCQFLQAFSGLWVISRWVLLGSFLVNLVLTTLDCCMWVGGSVDMVSPLALVRVVIIRFSLLF